VFLYRRHPAGCREGVLALAPRHSATRPDLPLPSLHLCHSDTCAQRAGKAALSEVEGNPPFATSIPALVPDSSSGLPNTYNSLTFR
jgi:hypothetical protein